MNSKTKKTNSENTNEVVPRAFRSLRSASFNKDLERLPEEIQNLSKEIFVKWKENPNSIKFKPLEVSNKNVYSAQIGPNHRALAQKTRDSDNNVAFFWLWIGSHEDYNKKIKQLDEFKKKSNTILENLTGYKSKIALKI